MDEFRRFQKAQCFDGAPNGGRRPYGCACCRPIRNLNSFKKVSRRLSRARLRQQDRRDDFSRPKIGDY